MVVARSANSAFTPKLAVAINAKRLCRIVLPVGAIEAAVENVVGRKLNDGHIEFGRSASSGFCAGSINPIGERWLTFCEIDRSVGGCIHDGVGSKIDQRAFNGFWSSEICLGPRNGLNVDIGRGGSFNQRLRNLTVAARDSYSHDLLKIRRKRV